MAKRAHDPAEAHTPRRGRTPRAATNAAATSGITGNTREVILDAGTELMADRGFAATTIGAICRATDCAPTAIYWHFGSKEGLLAAIVERSIERWYAELDAAMRAEAPDVTVPPPPDLNRFFGVIADSYRHAPQALRLLLWLGLDRSHPDRAVRTAVQQARRSAVERMAASIGALFEGSAAAGLRSASESLARLVLVHLDGIFLSHQIDDDTDRLDELFALSRTAVLAAATELLAQTTSTPTDTTISTPAGSTPSTPTDPAAAVRRHERQIP